MAHRGYIPDEVWARGIESICVENWANPKLRELVNAKLPAGWRFLSHTIKERDSFGPVTSLLVLIDGTGTTYEQLI